MPIANKKYIKFLPFLVIAFVLVFKSFGATLQLLKIGALDLGGKMYTEWWYTGTRPTFYGKAANSSSVSIKVSDVSGTATADATGGWSYLVDKESGDYDVEITSGAEKITFKLHLGQNMPANAGATSGTGPAGSVPDTGFDQFGALMFSVGVILLASYIYISSDAKRKSVFETRIIKED